MPIPNPEPGPRHLLCLSLAPRTSGRTRRGTKGPAERHRPGRRARNGRRHHRHRAADHAQPSGRSRHRCRNTVAGRPAPWPRGRSLMDRCRRRQRVSLAGLRLAQAAARRPLRLWLSTAEILQSGARSIRRLPRSRQAPSHAARMRVSLLQPARVRQPPAFISHGRSPLAGLVTSKTICSRAQIVRQTRNSDSSAPSTSRTTSQGTGALSRSRIRQRSATTVAPASVRIALLNVFQNIGYCSLWYWRFGGVEVASTLLKDNRATLYGTLASISPGKRCHGQVVISGWRSSQNCFHQECKCARRVKMYPPTNPLAATVTSWGLPLTT